MLKNLGPAVGNVFKQRLENPIWSTFVLTWSIVNWKLLAYLFFSPHSILTKLNIIDGKYSDPLHLWILPILISSIYLFLMPALIAYRDEQIKGAKVSALESQAVVEAKRYQHKLAAAKMEHELLDTKSGNKERQELLADKEKLQNELSITRQEKKEADTILKKMMEKHNQKRREWTERNAEEESLKREANKAYVEAIARMQRQCIEIDESTEYILQEFKNLLDSSTKEIEYQKRKTVTLLQDFKNLTRPNSITRNQLNNILKKYGVQGYKAPPKIANSKSSRG